MWLLFFWWSSNHLELCPKWWLVMPVGSHVSDRVLPGLGSPSMAGNTLALSISFGDMWRVYKGSHLPLTHLLCTFISLTSCLFCLDGPRPLGSVDLHICTRGGSTGVPNTHVAARSHWAGLWGHTWASKVTPREVSSLPVQWNGLVSLPHLPAQKDFINSSFIHLLVY